MQQIDDERQRARRNNRRNRLITTGLIVVTQVIGLSVHYATAWLHLVNVSLLAGGAILFIATLVWNPSTKRAA
jgi:Na+/H+ antiporter NhaB